MKYTIFKDKHFARPITVGFFIAKKVMKKTVVFKDSCRYWQGDADTLDGVTVYGDTNKVFGIGYLWSHKKDSARFAWTYNPDTDDVQIWAYCYVSGKRVVRFLASVPFNVKVDLDIEISSGVYRFVVFYWPEINRSLLFQKTVDFSHSKIFSFPLGPYFGGDLPAPRTMEIEIE